jgi:hypothetical protein
MNGYDSLGHHLVLAIPKLDKLYSFQMLFRLKMTTVTIRKPDRLVFKGHFPDTF